MSLEKFRRTRMVVLNQRSMAYQAVRAMTDNHIGAVLVSQPRGGLAGILTDRDLADSQLGTRHRAAIGVTEQSDAMSVVVSEETGAISVARNGRILRLDAGRLRTLLEDYFRPQL